LAAQPGDEVTLRIDTETGGDESGIEVRWAVEHRRGGQVLSEQSLSIGDGFLG
jgi:hypothetical protein